MFDLNLFFQKNKKIFSEIKVIIWDVDGVLWRNDALGVEIRKEFIRFLGKKINLKTKAAEALFEMNNRKYRGWGRTTEALTGINEREIIQEIEKNIYRPKFLKRDQKLLDTFKKLENYRHVILTNSTYKNTIATLKLLGFSPSDGGKDLKYFPFEKIFTIDRLSSYKPDKKAFMEVCKYTKLAPSFHIMIGDSLETDLLPAKKMGMKTCLIGSQHKDIDINLPDIYKFGSIL